MPVPRDQAMAVKVICFLWEYAIFSLIWCRFGADCEDFGYDGDEGPTHWGDKYVQCTGKHQSPIDIETSKAIRKEFPPLEFEYFDRPLETVELENNGHTVTLRILSDPKPNIRGGPLDGVYAFMQLHFHWGQNDTVGSENQIDHHSFPLELHLVMYNKLYGFERAARTEGGLTVLSFLVQVSRKDNNNYDGFEDGLREIKDLSSKKTLNNFVSLDDLITTERDKYFTYEGSLTTPPCSEVVTWIEFAKTVSLSAEQINTFRSLNTKDGPLTHNYRPVQPINDRVIYYSFNGAITRFNLSVLCYSIAIIVALCRNNI